MNDTCTYINCRCQMWLFILLIINGRSKKFWTASVRQSAWDGLRSKIKEAVAAFDNQIYKLEYWWGGGYIFDQMRDTTPSRPTLWLRPCFRHMIYFQKSTKRKGAFGALPYKIVKFIIKKKKLINQFIIKNKKKGSEKSL